MDKQPPEISTLLAIRDGEPRDATVSADDPQVARQLARINQLRSELQALPDVPIADEVWQKIRVAQQPPGGAGRSPNHWLRYPLATAASVFFASLLGIYLVFSGQQVNLDTGQPQLAGTSMQVEQGGLQLASLMNRSRELERRLQGVTPLTRAADVNVAAQAPTRQTSVVERQLMGRLADVDEQIALMFELGIQDPVQRERLWAQRVTLLESLVAVRGEQMSDLYEEGRSM